VSATTAVGPRTIQGELPPMEGPLSLRLLEGVGVASVAAILTWESLKHWPELAELSIELLPWLLVVILADLAPIPIWSRCS
jgi:hypothetical protein